MLIDSSVYCHQRVALILKKKDKKEKVKKKKKGKEVGRTEQNKNIAASCDSRIGMKLFATSILYRKDFSCYRPFMEL